MQGPVFAPGLFFICSPQPDSRIIPPALGISAWGTANVAKLVDALDLGSSGATLGSSSLPIRTNYLCDLNFSLILGLPGQNRYDAVHGADFCNHAFLLYFLR